FVISAPLSSTSSPRTRTSCCAPFPAPRPPILASSTNRCAPPWPSSAFSSYESRSRAEGASDERIPRSPGENPVDEAALRSCPSARLLHRALPHLRVAHPDADLPFHTHLQ